MSWDEAQGRLVERSHTDEYTKVTDSASAVTWSAGWYVVSDDVTYGDCAVVTGEVHLILADGCDFTVKKGIRVPEGSTLNIYGQSAGSGKLTATGVTVAVEPYATPGIGGGGAINIHGGDITAKGETYVGSDNYDYSGAGIGSGDYTRGYDESNASISIYGGTINAEGGAGSAGIGGGYGNSFEEISIHGGTIIAEGGHSADGSGAGIGSGNSGRVNSIKITGGKIEAVSTDTGNSDGGGAGIGCGYSGNVSLLKSLAAILRSRAATAFLAAARASVAVGTTAS